jgi:hypothetical protein
MLKLLQPYWEVCWYYTALAYYRGLGLWYSVKIWLIDGKWPEEK